MKTYDVILAGFGTVGQGLAELLVDQRARLEEEHGLRIRVVGISDLGRGSWVDAEGLDLADLLARAGRSESMLEDGDRRRFSGSVLDMVRSVSADAFLEATYTDISTGEPATSFIRAALERGMDVATTNKGPIALAYAELSALARERGVQLRYEGTVMSGTPVFHTWEYGLRGTGVQEVSGILNGTTNFMLGRMEEGLDYETALSEAQALGYAEAVPDADVQGWDALAKITILANTVFGQSVGPGAFPCKGIDGLTREDLAAAAAQGERYKLIGRVGLDDQGQLSGSVAPERLPLTHPLAAVQGALNALSFQTDSVGTVTVVGPGAGRRETGYSLLADLITMGAPS